MKPICKAEAKWEFWRAENPRLTGKFTKFAKKQMARARRRFHKGNSNAEAKTEEV